MHISQLSALDPDQRATVLDGMSENAKAALRYHWPFWARAEQLSPDGDWTYWLILAGRGFGKSRAGAEFVREEVKTRAMVNLIGATSDDARDIMIEGESGIMACCPFDERPVYKKHESKLEWPNGAISLVFTADQPDRLRGKQHMSLWCDEMAAWRYPDAWDQAKLGLRLGPHPRACATTTPRPLQTIRDLVADPNCVVTRGSTFDNRANLAESFFTDIVNKYDGTRLGRQELYAEILSDNPGALWRRSSIDTMRVMDRKHLPEFRRVVVAVDPAISTGEGADETGIVCVALGVDGKGYVLEDASGRYSPDEWARQVRALYERWQADRIVAEKNQGGDMVAHTIRSVIQARVVMVTASRGKVTRAEPVAALYDQERIHHVGKFDALEDQMVSFTPDFDRKANGYSPDRVDALVWGFTDLFPSLVARDNRPRSHVSARPHEVF